MAMFGYITTVTLAGLGAIFVSGRAGLVVPDSLTLLFWLLANMLGEVLWLPAPRGRGYLSMATAANFATILVLPAPLAIVTTALAGAFVDGAFRRRRWYQVLFNFSACCIAVGAASAVLTGVGPHRPSLETLISPLNAGPLLAAALAYFLVNTSLVATVIALERKEPVLRIWRSGFATNYEFVGSFILFLLGFHFAAMLLTWGYLSAFLVTIAAYFVRDSYRRYVESADRGEPGKPEGGARQVPGIAPPPK